MPSSGVLGEGMEEVGVNNTFHIEGVLIHGFNFCAFDRPKMTFLEKYLTFLNRQHTVKS